MAALENNQSSYSEYISGKVVLVCRAGLELGCIIAERFAQCGAVLALQDFSPVHLDSSLQRVRQTGARGEEFIADTSKKIPALVMLDEINNELGSIDILVNMSAVQPQKSLLEIDEWDWQRTLELNVNSAFLMTQLVAREMSIRGGGVIFNLVSCDASLKNGGASAYMTSTSAIEGFSRAAAAELAPQNIRVYCIKTGPNTDPALSHNGKREDSASNRNQDDQSIFHRVASWMLFLSMQTESVPFGPTIDPNWGTPWDKFYQAIM